MSHFGTEEKRIVTEDAAGRRHEHVERREGDLRGPLDKAGDKIKEGWEKTKVNPEKIFIILHFII